MMGGNTVNDFFGKTVFFKKGNSQLYVVSFLIRYDLSNVMQQAPEFDDTNICP